MNYPNLKIKGLFNKYSNKNKSVRKKKSKKNRFRRKKFEKDNEKKKIEISNKLKNKLSW